MTATRYAEFLAGKTVGRSPIGRPCEPEDTHPYLHDWQREIVAWAVRTGRAGLFTTTGTGKTLMQLEHAATHRGA